MRKWSAQPTGNGKRIIIIITTLLPFRECLKAVGEKKRRKIFFSFFSFLRFLLCKKETRKTNAHSVI
jgi:hypothetical protein